MGLRVKRQVTNCQKKNTEIPSIKPVIGEKSEPEPPEYEEKIYIIGGAFWCQESTAGHVVHTYSLYSLN